MIENIGGNFPGMRSLKAKSHNICLRLHGMTGDPLDCSPSLYLSYHFDMQRLPLLVYMYKAIFFYLNMTIFKLHRLWALF
ncbi:hypothetical protein ACOSQ2_026431 [Xanthoceras sorbifolium]